MKIQTLKFVEVADITRDLDIQDMFREWSFEDHTGMIHLQVVADRLEGCQEFDGEFATELENIQKALGLGAEFMDYG